MSVITCLERARGWRAVLLFGCLLARPGSACAPAESVCFHAVSLSAAESGALPLSAAPEPVSFAAFMPAPEAAKLRALIARLEEEGDLFSPAIAEHSAELGRLLQAEGRHVAALQAFDRSLQILRRHEGLGSQAQASLLEARIESLLALGDWASGDEQQQALLALRQQVFADDPLALAAAQAEWADWNVRYHFRTKRTPVSGGRSPEQEAQLAQRLGQALLGYHRALALLDEPPAAAGHDPRVDIERKIAALTLLVNGVHRQNTPSLFTKAGRHSINQSRRANHPLLTQHGREALTRVLDYGKASGDPLVVAERELELGDWYLLLDQHREAYAAYRAALETLRGAGLSDEEVAEAAGLGLPVRNPEDSLFALGSETPDGAYDGYLDVAIEVDPYGRAGNARVLDGHAHDAGVEAELLARLQEDRFRPAFDEEGAGRAGEVRLRYYFLR